MALRACVGRAWAVAASLNCELANLRGRSSPQHSVCFIGRGGKLSHGALALQSAFFGTTQQLQRARIPKSKSVTRTWLPTARIKRRKDPSFDNVIQREKKLKIVSRIKDLLVKQPGRVMSLRDLGKNRKQIGLTGKRRCVALLNRYPAVFKVFEEGCNVFYFRLTPQAEEHHQEELRLREELEIVAVGKLRKMLMMSIDKRILLSKLAHVKRDFGLSEDYLTSVVPKYPQYFHVVEIEDGPALELKEWDPSLAVSAWERKKAQEEAAREAVSLERPNKFRRIDLPKGYNLSRKDREVILKFQDLPYISPYADVSSLSPSSPEAEKHAVAVVHEVLSLTLEKRLLIDHLTHFRRDFKFSQRIHSMIIRHPELFYVSLKGARDSVFLREAYRGSELIDKDPLVEVKARLGELVSLGKKGAPTAAGRREGDEEDEDEDDDESDEDGEDGIGSDDDDDEEEDDEDSESDDDEMDMLAAVAEADKKERELVAALKTSGHPPRVRERW